jgi:hypothetical protein
MEKAQAYIALGDLHLSFDRPQRAFSTYQNALDILTSGGYSQSQAEQLLTPQPTIVVPEFGIHNYSREFFGISPDTDIPYLGHIDVTFNKDRFGSLSGINILSATDNTPPQVRSALVDHLRTQRFRPQFSGGESVGEEDVRLRYFYYFQTGE